MKSASSKQTVARRQNPISCKLCRLKKLRCNRQHPCLNCAARNVTCEREASLPTSIPGSLPAPSSTSGQTTTGNEGAILAKLDRLETLLLQINGSPRQDVGAIANVCGLGQQPSPETVSSPFGTETLSETAHKVDAKRLEDVTTVENLVVSPLARPREQLLTQAASRSLRWPPVRSPIHRTNRLAQRAFPLPARQHPQCSTPHPPPKPARGLALLDIYAEHVDYMQHIVLLPKVRTQILAFYEYLEDQHLTQKSPASDGPVSSAALILAIFASAAACLAELRSKFSASDPLYPPSLLLMTIHSARHNSIQWAKMTFECLEHARHLNLLCLENIQAMIMLSFLMYNLEGFSARARTGFIQALGQARDLGLHRIDHGEEGHKDRNPVDTEIARRVWWHMCASDWVLALSGGPQEGAYNIQPRHMRVNLPRNIHDSDLLDPSTPTDFSHPLHIPTSASYLIQRIKLGIICRKVVDAMPLSPSTPDIIPYEEFITLDREFEEYLEELPPFYQVDDGQQSTNTKRQKTRITRQSATTRPKMDYVSSMSSGGGAEPFHIATQRFMVRMTSYTRRCKFHQPFLVRGFTDPKYHYSRDVCLKSARVVIGMQQELDQSGLIATGLLGLSGINHHLFFATIALAMDLCFNRVPGQGVDVEEKEKERRAEVRRAMAILEAAQERALVARRFLENLRGVLRKYGIQIDDHRDAEGWEFQDRLGGPQSVDVQQAGGLEALSALSQPHPSDFEEIWQTYIGASGYDVTGWEELFDELENQNQNQPD